MRSFDCLFQLAHISITTTDVVMMISVALGVPLAMGALTAWLLVWRTGQKCLWLATPVLAVLWGAAGAALIDIVVNWNSPYR
jgi:hypothetical protein